MHLFLDKTSLHIVKLKQLASIESNASVVQDVEGCKKALLANTPNILWLDASESDMDWVLGYVLAHLGCAHRLTIAVKKTKALKAHIKARFRVVKAAGGLVFKGSLLLFIFRNGHWDLPKGKLMAGENLRACARREVMEECGVKVRVLTRVARTYHLLPRRNDKWSLKRTDWYQMRLLSDKHMRPQYEEGIQDVTWVPPNEWQARSQQAYPSIVHTLQEWKKSTEKTPSTSNKET